MASSKLQKQIRQFVSRDESRRLLRSSLLPLIQGILVVYQAWFTMDRRDGIKYRWRSGWHSHEAKPVTKSCLRQRCIETADSTQHKSDITSFCLEDNESFHNYGLMFLRRKD